MRVALEDRFWVKVNKDGPWVPGHPELGPCHLWTASAFLNGYGKFKGAEDKNVGAHRQAWELEVGPIPPGLELDHLCHTLDLSCSGGPLCGHRPCVSTLHLEPVTHAENLLRGRKGALAAATVECPSGHPYDELNTAFYRGERYCRTCKREKTRARRARSREIEAAA